MTDGKPLVNAFVLRGAKIIFADSSSTNPNIDADKIEQLITPRTKVIVPVHYAGIACDMDKIMSIANKYNLYVVEDAAQSIDSFYNGTPLGGIGHLSAFSFHETKNITSGEGGAIILNNESLIKRAEIIREKGTNRSAFFRGEINNVLTRFYDAAKQYNLTIISRLTGDNPFVISRMQKELVRVKKLEGNKACIVTTRNTGLPKGLDFEAFNISALELANAEATDSDDLEHVTTFMYKDARVKKIIKKIEINNIISNNYSIDTLEDLINARNISRSSYPSMSILTKLD